MAFAVSRGEANVYLVLVIPVIVGTGPLALLGVFLVCAGFLLTFLLWPSRLVAEPGDGGGSPVSSEGAPLARRWGGVVLHGRFSFSVGFDSRWTRMCLLLGVFSFT